MFRMNSKSSMFLVLVYLTIPGAQRSGSAVNIPQDREGTVPAHSPDPHCHRSQLCYFLMEPHCQEYCEGTLRRTIAIARSFTPMYMCMYCDIVHGSVKQRIKLYCPLNGLMFQFLGT